MAVDRVLIFDTTLRDGEQSPGVHLGTAEKVEIATHLARLGVDIIEAGFPVSSPGDREAVAAVAAAVPETAIAALARTLPRDIEVAAAALAAAARPRIHVFVSTSPVHMRAMLKKTPAEVLELSVAAVRQARAAVADVEFSAQDASRSDPVFLCELLSAVVEAGAGTINIPDTVGYATPTEFGELIRRLRAEVPGLDRVVTSVHCHNDLGLATANSLAGVAAGARQVECTMNGIGERAGNTALEEVVMALRTRRDHFGLTTGIVTEHLAHTSALVAALTGMPVQPNKAVVGANAFAHEAGIYQDGVLKDPATYEIMRPADVGLDSNRLVLGKHSGRHAFRQRLVELGFRLDDQEAEQTFARFKEIADRKGQVNDDDLVALVAQQLHAAPGVWRLVSYQVATGSQGLPTASVCVSGEGGLVQEASCGDGPVDALFAAVGRCLGRTPRLVNYQLRAVTGGQDALGEATVRLADDGATMYVGRGVSTDVLEASVLAYLDAVNRLEGGRQVEVSV